MHDEAAAVHLFRVSAGLDSLVPGRGRDPRPGRGRVRGGARRARCSTGSSARRSQLGKRVRTETAIGESPASVPSAAAALAEQVFGDLDGPARAADRRRPDRRARRRQPLGPRRDDRVRREPQRPRPAPALAARFGAEPLALDELAVEARRGRRRARLDERARASSSAPPTCPSRRRQPLFFIDIAVPRDVDPAVHELDGCYLYDIDDLEAVVAETLAGRRARPRRAEQLVVEEATRFREWQASLEVVPAIASLRARAEEIRAAELAKLGDLPERRAAHDRVGDRADPEQAAAPADRADEGGGARRRRRRVRRRRAPPVRPRGEER